MLVVIHFSKWKNKTILNKTKFPTENFMYWREKKNSTRKSWLKLIGFSRESIPFLLQMNLLQTFILIYHRSLLSERNGRYMEACTGKTAAIRRVAVRDTNISRHHGAPIKANPQWDSAVMYGDLREARNATPRCRETPGSRTAIIVWCWIFGRLVGGHKSVKCPSLPGVSAHLPSNPLFLYTRRNYCLLY